MSSNTRGASRKGKRKVAPTTLRTIVQLAVVVFVCVGLAFHTGTGTLSSWGIGAFSVICPLGALEASLGSKSIVPVGFICFTVVVVAVLVVGRAFCSWGCPVPLLQRLFGVKGERKKRKGNKEADEADLTLSVSAAQTAAEPAPPERGSTKPQPIAFPNEGVAAAHAAHAAPTPNPATDPTRGGLGDSRNWVLGGVLVSSAIFGFPVFCLVCPVGLTFAALIAIWRAFQFGEATLSLVVFPAILVVELVVARRWCHTLCPIGALLSLVSRGNKTFRPTIDTNACLVTTGGASCNECVKTCPEGIDLHAGAVSSPKNECLKCGECGHACPVHAITFPVFQKKESMPSESEKSKDGKEDS